MARTKVMQRKRVGPTGPPVPVWHRALTRAAEQGGAALLEEALAAERFRQAVLLHVTDLGSSERHTAVLLPDGTLVAEVPQSPFPAASNFGILPYAAWHGHLEILQGYLAAGADTEKKGKVLTEEYPRKWAREGLGLHSSTIGVDWTVSGAHMSSAVHPTAFQIAYYMRDVGAVRALQQTGAAQGHAFLLDLIKPRPGSLFASKAGSWSLEAHTLYPATFKAAVAELLRISRKYGGSRGPGGRLVWPFNSNTVTELLLPLMAENFTDWLDIPSREAWAVDDDSDWEVEEQMAGQAEGQQEQPEEQG